MATATITRLDPTTTNASTVRFEVEFGTSISPTIDESWFDLVTFGTIRNAAITSVQRVSNPGGGTKVIVTVATGTGDGTIHINLNHGYDFDQAVTYPSTQERPQSAVLQDVGSDGRADLIFVNETNNTVSVLQGNGDGTFGLRVNYPVGNRPTSVAVGDVNHDGRPDLIVANDGGHSISVLRGIGSGAFSDAASFDLFIGNDWTYPEFVALADVNGDTHLDILAATTTQDFPSGDLTIGLTVIYGHGDGSFTQGPTYAEDAGFRAASTPVRMVTGDFDRDGRTDVMILTLPNQAWVLMGQADGSFSTEGRLSTPTQNNPNTVLVADFNRDGRPDLVTSAQFGMDIRLGLGDGSFAGQASFVSSLTPFSLAAADVNRDGNLDIIGGMSSVAGAVFILLGRGDGTFTSDGRLFRTSSTPSSIVTGDVNGDGGIDIVTTDLTSASYSVLLNEVPTRGAQPYTLDRTPPRLEILTTGGLTNQTVQTVSGTADATTATSISIYEGTTLRGTATVAPGGSWSTTVTLSGQGWHTLEARAADALGNQGTSNEVAFRLDTLPPIVDITSPGGPTNSTHHIVTGTLGSEDAGRTVTILEGSTVLGTTVAGADGSWSVSVELSGEGMHRVVAQASDQAGNAASSSALSYNLDLTRPRLLAIEQSDPSALDAPFVEYVIRFSEKVVGFAADHLSLVASGAQSEAKIISVTALPNGTDYAVRIATAPGDGTIALRVDGLDIADRAGNALPGGSFEPAQLTSLSGVEPTFMAAGDLDGDGDLDVVVVSNSSSRATILLNQGDGTFARQATTVATSPHPGGFALADMNGDGRLDIVTIGDLGLAIAPGNGNGTFGNSFGVNFNQRRTFAVGDLDNDGHLDVVYSQQTQSVVLLNNGNGTFRTGATITGSYSVRAIADLNRDGKGDAISVLSGSIVIGFGDGAGGFQGTSTLPTGSTDTFNEALAIGDLDGDGWVDLVVGHETGVSVLRGTGNGSFAAAQTFAVGTGQLVRYAIQLADLDLDGHLDVIAAGASNTAVLMGNGDGTLAPAQLYSPVPVRKGLVVADATGDGSLDLLVAASNGVALLPSRPEITTGPAYTIDRSLNAAPIGAQDAYAAAAGQVLTIPVGRGVLANDTDADSTGLTAILLEPPLHGTLSLLANGRFDYRPSDGFVGFDSFRYRTSDGVAFSDPVAVTIAVASAGDDRLRGTSQDDRADGLAGNDSLLGMRGDDSLTGGADNDTLDGGKGADSLTGGAGNDLLVVDNAGDQASEAPAGGHDTVRAGVNWTLGAELEDLVLTGKAKSGTGNALDNAITGTAGKNSLSGEAGSDTLDGGDGADLLDGGAGADSMVGGGGNDAYIVDDAGDVVVEQPLGGTDEVRTSLASTTLGTEFENLSLLAGAANGTGNAQNNTIGGNNAANLLSGLDGKDLLLGGGGDDTLLGGAGGDTLEGGGGRDSLDGGANGDLFRWLAPSQGRDSIAGFSAAQDDLAFSAGGFGGGLTAGVALTAAQFEANATGTASTAAVRFVLDTVTGVLSYDADGSGVGTAAVIVTFAGATPALTTADFIIVG